MDCAAERLRTALVAEMTKRTADACFEPGRVGATAEQLRIVVSFEHEEVSRAQCRNNFCGHVTEVSEECNARGRIFNEKPHRFCCIMCNGNGMKDNFSKVQGDARLEWHPV
jgi:hypothetical protein